MNKIQPFKTSESYTCNSKNMKYRVVDKWLAIQTFLSNSFELFIGCILFNIGLINTKQSGFCKAVKLGVLFLIMCLVLITLKYTDSYPVSLVQMVLCTFPDQLKTSNKLVETC